MSNFVPFGSVCNLQNGRAFKPEEWTDLGTPIIRIQNLNDETKPFNYCDFEVESRFHVKTGDLLFSWSGTPGTSFGAFFWNRGKGFLNQHIFRVDIDNSKISKNYLRYAINSKLNLIIDQAHGGVGLKHITKGKLEAIEIPLPPLEEQKCIAAILDKADGIRRKRHQAIQLADDFLRSVFLDMFGDPVTNPKEWEVKTLDEVCSKITDGEHGTVKRLKSGRQYLMARNIDRSGNLDLSEVSYISEEDHQRIYKRCAAQEGDVLLVCVGATIGKALIVPKMTEFSLARSVALLKPNELIFSEYLLALISTNAIQKRFVSSGNSSAQAGLYLGKIKEIVVQVPPLEMQIKFKSVVKQVREHLTFKYKESIYNDQLFESLSQKAFSGEL